MELLLDKKNGGEQQDGSGSPPGFDLTGK